jgi:hypothetical protein
MHEQSETVQMPDGLWVNVYGRKTPNAGNQLPNSGRYQTLAEALRAASDRSMLADRPPQMPPAQPMSLAELLRYILERK